MHDDIAAGKELIGRESVLEVFTAEEKCFFLLSLF